MTDSESDVGVIHLRNRLLELLYSSDAVLSVDQIARILAVDESRIIQELKRVNHHDVVYKVAEGIVQVRSKKHSMASDTGAVSSSAVGSPWGVSGSAVTPVVAEAGDYQYAKYGSDGYSPNYGARAVALKSASRKTRYRRFIPRNTRGNMEGGGNGVSGDEEASVKGRVGYVCVADEFRLSELEAHYRLQGYYTKFDFDVLHIRFSDKEMNAKETRAAAVAASEMFGGRGVEGGSNSNKSNNSNNAGGEKPSDRGTGILMKNQRKAGFDLFVFEYGAIVWWGFDQRFFKIVENDFMLPNSPIARHMVNRYSTQIVSENYPVWCTYTLERKETLDPDENFRERLRFDHFLIPFGRGDPDTSNVSMLCASHALAQSAKIDYLELKVQELTESCSPLPRELREKGRATITERRLLQLRGEVLSYRLMLKSGSNLMDEPDFFWENAYLKPVFQATKEYFEISERVEALDNKLDAANEILSMLAEEFSQRHGARLEWIVIWLVFVEVVIGVLELLIEMKPWFYQRT